MRMISTTPVYSGLLILFCWALTGPMVQCRPAQDDDNEIDSATSGGEEDYENLLVDSLSAIGERLFGIPDNKSGELVSQWNPESPINPEEVGTYYEGDILHIPNMARNGLKSLSSRWPKGVVPYEIGGYFRMARKSSRNIQPSLRNIGYGYEMLPCPMLGHPEDIFVDIHGTKSRQYAIRSDR
ncbi:hypothetical protein M8J76_004482 [Diaphorina citri]|nr:hypothetical protein M8J76_004482 [Diaphorina citri]